MRTGHGLALAFVVGVGSAAAVGCGDGRSCGKGTYRDGHTCRPYNPHNGPPEITVDPPARTRFVGDVRLTSSEPATIYYTTNDTVPTTSSANEPDVVVIADLDDDAVVQFFAVDASGDASEVVRFTWQTDRVGPGPLRNFSLALAGADRTVTWTNPDADDLVGLLVARVVGPAVAPEPERIYAAGEDIAPGVTVVYTDPAAVGGEPGTFSESMPATPGMVRYVGWAYDDLGNYGAAGADLELVTIPPQNGAITMNAATGAVNVTAAPANVGIKGAATFDTGTLTVSLEIENLTTRTLFAPKVLMTNLTGTTGSWQDADGTLGTEGDYRAYGGAIPPGGTATRTYEFATVGATDVLSADVRIRFGRIIGTGFWDSNAGSVLDEEAVSEALVLDSAGPKAFGLGGEHSLRPGGITPDGYMIMGSRTTSRLSQFDLSTGALMGGVTLSEFKSALTQVVLDPGGATAYGILLFGHPYASRLGGGYSELVRLDPIGLHENGRIPLCSTKGKADMRMSPDGKHLAITCATDVVIVDLDEFRVARHLAGVGGSFGGGGGGSLVPTAVAWSPDGTQLATAESLGVKLFSTSSWTAGAPLALPPTGGKIHRMVFGSDGRVWVGRANELQAVTTATGDVEIISYQSGHLEVFDGKIHTASDSDSSLYRLDNAGVEEAQWDTSFNFRGHSLVRSPF